MLDRINIALTNADLVLTEQVNPQFIPDWLMPADGDEGMWPWLKRIGRFFVQPHMSRSFAIGGGVNLNDILPPGFSMSGESIDEFNRIVTNNPWLFPPFWWTLPGAETRWMVFNTLFLVYGLEYDLGEFASWQEWMEYLHGLGVLAGDILHWLLQHIDVPEVDPTGPIEVAPNYHGSPGHYKGPFSPDGRQYLYH